MSEIWSKIAALQVELMQHQTALMAQHQWLVQRQVEQHQWLVQRQAEIDKRQAENDLHWLELERKMDQVIATLAEHSRILAALPDIIQKRIGFGGSPQQQP
ncbi:MAG: hypothetical protein AB1714_02000 [Acidobacteriota bacterium]